MKKIITSFIVTTTALLTGCVHHQHITEDTTKIVRITSTIDPRYENLTNLTVFIQSEFNTTLGERKVLDTAEGELKAIGVRIVSESHAADSDLMLGCNINIISITNTTTSTTYDRNYIHGELFGDPLSINSRTTRTTPKTAILYFTKIQITATDTKKILQTPSNLSESEAAKAFDRSLVWMGAAICPKQHFSENANKITTLIMQKYGIDYDDTVPIHNANY